MAKNLVSELLPLLKDERHAIKKPAFQVLAYESGHADGVSSIQQNPSLIELLVNELKSATEKKIESSLLCLPYILSVFTNVSTTVSGANAILSEHITTILPVLIEIITDKGSKDADVAAGILTNLTRSSVCCKNVLSELAKNEVTLHRLFMATCTTNYNTAGNNLDRLMNVLENISQLEEGRRLLLDKDKCVVHRVLPFTHYQAHTRRRAAIACLYNCCYQKDDHCWLIGPEVDLASYLCVPLLSGEGHFTDEEQDELSDLLAYPPADKKIEADPQIRLLLVQALMQLCSTRAARESLRRQSVYCVLREYHKWETEAQVLPLLEDLVNILIRTEEEINRDDLSEVEVPAEMASKFEEMDKIYSDGNEKMN